MRRRSIPGVPGVLYDGNRLTDPSVCDSFRCSDMPDNDPNGPVIPRRQLAQLTATQNFQVDTPVLALSTAVAAFHDKRNGRTVMVVTEPTTELGMTGFSCAMRPDDWRRHLSR